MEEPSLRWIRSPVEWGEFERLPDECALCLHYTQAGSFQGPGAAIAEVVVSETWSVIAITLFERELTSV